MSNRKNRNSIVRFPHCLCLCIIRCLKQCDLFVCFFSGLFFFRQDFSGNSYGTSVSNQNCCFSKSALQFQGVLPKVCINPILQIKSTKNHMCLAPLSILYCEYRPSLLKTKNKTKKPSN